MTSYFVGVPRTFIIYINWSICESPRKGGVPFIIYTRTQPVDHISICQVYSVAPKINYGAL